MVVCIDGSSSTFSRYCSLFPYDADPHKGHDHNYYIGVALCFYIAAAISVANVVGPKCNKLTVSTSELMFVSGCSSVLLSLLSTIFLTNRLLTDPTSLTTKAAALLPVCGLTAMIAYWTITLAISITGNPTLIAMLRSTEILISLVTESIWWSQVPGTLSLVGALLVSWCVITMAGHDKIMMVIKKQFGASTDKTDIIDTRL